MTISTSLIKPPGKYSLHFTKLPTADVATVRLTSSSDSMYSNWTLGSSYLSRDIAAVLAEAEAVFRAFDCLSIRPGSFT